jgi:D-glycero-alpha-D-manno-heptose 1-phosphate guanylyltransferase
MEFQKRIKEAIILAGGLGTRLRSAVPDLPKCMAPVAGKPFLDWLIDHLTRQGVEKFIFALGYKSEAIEDFLIHKFAGKGTAGSARFVAERGLHYDLSVEKEPLGTGGAIRLACARATAENVLVLNGDTFFGIDAGVLAATHLEQKADCTLCLKPMQDFDRYGVVELDGDGRVSRFLEKRFYKTGLINGGVYALNVPRFLGQDLPEKFSFEKDWLETSYTDRALYGIVQDGYFIDIGIPEDYERAQREADKLR